MNSQSHNLDEQDSHRTHLNRDEASGCMSIASGTGSFDESGTTDRMGYVRRPEKIPRIESATVRWQPSGSINDQMDTRSAVILQRCRDLVQLVPISKISF